MAEDAPVETVPNPLESTEAEVDIKEEDSVEEKSEKSDHGAEDTGHPSGDTSALSNDQYKALKNITEILTNHKIEVKGDEDHYPSILFRRIPNRRNLPDYHEIIKEPVAISTLKGKIQRKQYTGIPEFVRDFAFIVHNAQVYNRLNSAPVRDAFELKRVFEEELQKLVEEGLVDKSETAFPDLGEIPYATPEPDPVSDEDEDNDEDADEDEDDDEAEGDDSDDERRKKRGRRGRLSLQGRGKSRDEDDGDGRKRRGRPPKVDTPMEARIKAILKGLRKPKDQEGNLKVVHFERLPDKAEYPDYYQEIRDPIALDMIKKKAKRKKYQTLDQFMKDVDLLFNNAKQFNEDGSEIYRAAEDLHAEAVKLLDIEKAKPDEEYLMEDGRRPLPAGILHNNQHWKVGDWVHIRNPNDVTKPIIAQIYRTWEDPGGQKWINACWYYRPEQTVHQFEKHFLPSEVVKTGQYRDHQIEDVIDRCFVMFVTRFSRGRPRGFEDGKKEVYVCEARYNEDKRTFNKIKTWASCLPDEVRDKDYEMELFDQPRRIKKVRSPLLHLLKDDMKETDELPSPQWGHPNAPPVVGAIHKHPRDENQSPPPEPTPPPPPTPPPAAVRQPSTTTMPQLQSRPPVDRQSTSSSGPLNPHVQNMHPAPSLTPQPNPYPGQAISPAPGFNRPPSYPQSQTPRIQPSIPPQAAATHQPLPYTAHQQLHPAPNLSLTHQTPYAAATPSQAHGRPPMQSSAPPYMHYTGGAGPSTYADSRTPEAYVLSDQANQSIPSKIRDQFQQDDEGRILFFTRPPTMHDHGARGQDGKLLAHTESYLAAKAERDKIIAARKRARDEAASLSLNGPKRTKTAAVERANGVVKS